MRYRFLLAALPFAMPSASALAGEPDDLKVAIVYNIIRFTRFAPPHPGRIVMCIWAGQATGRAFVQLDGRSVPDGRLAVRIVTRPSDLKGGCHIAFLQGEAPSVVPDDVRMTIGDVAGFAERGGTVGLRRFGRQVTFEINAQAGSVKGVQFSARLLNLASVVHTR